jgi:hypothetical protein
VNEATEAIMTATVLGTLIILMVALPLMVWALWATNRHPALVHKKRMQKIVEGVGNAQEFAAVMAQQGRMKAKAGRAATVALVKRVGLEQAGYPHRCEYCGNPLYINQRECTGCGAPRK